ncbi:hypothetical protein CLPUN_09400 [Clostridium puniceum]|uniref:Uncharacterized protein n=1 Tax=Clostridium puniceum TaxID=29367 RepID=A0A1S8TVK3_9CLOT|nr:hypothetical protein [Clostridium puniceum]OOM81756.1 hypothetical protein CLPUN_09400 [Clostridium puniceum]
MQEFEEFCGGKGISKDYDAIKKFNEDYGYEFILRFADIYNDSINEIKTIKKAIDGLENWKKKSWFKLHETQYEINFFGCDRARDENPLIKVTLPKAKQMLKESLIRYKALNSIFLNMKRVFGKDDDKYLEEYLNVEE